MEVAITAEPYIPNLAVLRDKIAKDRELLSALIPESQAYIRLQGRIHNDVQKLLDYEDDLQRRQDNLAAAEAAAQRARAAKPPVDDGVPAGGTFAVIGLIVSYFTWGSWWLVIGIVLLLMGVITLVDGVRNTWRQNR